MDMHVQDHAVVLLSPQTLDDCINGAPTRLTSEDNVSVESEARIELRSPSLLAKAKSRTEGTAADSLNQCFRALSARQPAMMNDNWSFRALQLKTLCVRVSIALNHSETVLLSLSG